MLHRCNLLKSNALDQGKRTLFHWINLQFNALDTERQKIVGPDRSCAEWILRNGGAVKWMNSSELHSDYNSLPDTNTRFKLEEIDGSNSSIMYNGFEHFRGCNHITKLILHQCTLVDDKALAEIRHLKQTLLHLQVSSCPNVTDGGILHLNIINKLKTLIFYDLKSVKDLSKCVQALKSSLPKCNIKFV